MEAKKDNSRDHHNGMASHLFLLKDHFCFVLQVIEIVAYPAIVAILNVTKDVGL